LPMLPCLERTSKQFASWTLESSRVDARVQVADILGGVGREIARLAEAGTFDDDLQRVTSEMLDFNGMWSEGSPLDVLYERRPPQYIQAYLDTLS